MKQIGLIAVNFVREQRWPILVLMLWVVGFNVMGLAVDLRASRDDILGVFKQLAIYGIAFAIFFGASAIHNERKTRRILAVLSKGVGRVQYITGLLAGIAIATGIYCFAMGLTGSWILGDAGFSSSHLWFLMLCVMVDCLLAATIAVTFSTFLNPLFATLGTVILAGIPALAIMRFDWKWGISIPVGVLLDPLIGASFDSPGRTPWKLLPLALAEALGFWLLASWIFKRRDIAVAVD
jgi:ABC-type transport system involved in multi-copper enzyme maturation permease subunit